MKITLLQTDIIWNRAEENTANAERMMEKASKSDVYILPETFSTGFMTRPDSNMENGERTLEWMKRMARRYDAAIVGSVATACGGSKFRNRMYFVRPDDTEEHYDKRHLFSYAGENKHFEAGSERVVAEWRGVRFLLEVCYDLRFPVWSRNRGDYDCVIYVANWPTSRIAAWETLLKARGIENQCYVCGVNRVSGALRAALPESPENPENPALRAEADPQIDYIGRSQVVDAYGKVVARCEDYCEECVSAELDMERLRHFREKFPVLGDADGFEVDLYK